MALRGLFGHRPSMSTVSTQLATDTADARGAVSGAFSRVAICVCVYDRNTIGFKRDKE